MMRAFNLEAPTHLTEALRTNMSGGRTVAQMLSDAAANMPFISMAELAERVKHNDLELVLLDVREKEAFVAGHIPGARLCRADNWNCVSTQNCPIPPSAFWSVASSGTSPPSPPPPCASWATPMPPRWMAASRPGGKPACR